MDPYFVVITLTSAFAAEMYPANQITKIVKIHKFQPLKATLVLDITSDQIKTKILLASNFNPFRQHKSRLVKRTPFLPNHLAVDCDHHLALCNIAPFRYECYL